MRTSLEIEPRQVPGEVGAVHTRRGAAAAFSEAVDQEVAQLMGL
jgi:hypothetical protein